MSDYNASEYKFFVENKKQVAYEIINMTYEIARPNSLPSVLCSSP